MDQKSTTPKRKYHVTVSIFGHEIEQFILLSCHIMSDKYPGLLTAGLFLSLKQLCVARVSVVTQTY